MVPEIVKKSIRRHFDIGVTAEIERCPDGLIQKITCHVTSFSFFKSRITRFEKKKKKKKNSGLQIHVYCTIRCWLKR